MNLQKGTYIEVEKFRNENFLKRLGKRDSRIYEEGSYEILKELPRYEGKRVLLCVRYRGAFRHVREDEIIKVTSKKPPYYL